MRGESLKVSDEPLALGHGILPAARIVVDGPNVDALLPRREVPETFRVEAQHVARIQPQRIAVYSDRSVPSGLNVSPGL